MMDAIIAGVLVLVALSLPLLIAILRAAWPWLAKHRGIQHVPGGSTSTTEAAGDDEWADEHFSFYWYYP